MPDHRLALLYRFFASAAGELVVRTTIREIVSAVERGIRARRERRRGIGGQR